MRSILSHPASTDPRMHYTRDAALIPDIEKYETTTMDTESHDTYSIMLQTSYSFEEQLYFLHLLAAFRQFGILASVLTVEEKNLRP
jgi:hypothetical protein